MRIPFKREWKRGLVGKEDSLVYTDYNYGRIQKATIYTDSQVALLALSSPKNTSSVVNKCIKAFSSLVGQLDLERTQKADELAKWGVSLDK